MINCGALEKLMTAPILPGDLVCALAGVALKLGWPAGHKATVSEHFLRFEDVRRSTNVPVRFCTASSIPSISEVWLFGNEIVLGLLVSGVHFQ